MFFIKINKEISVNEVDTDYSNITSFSAAAFIIILPFKVSCWFWIIQTSQNDAVADSKCLRGRVIGPGEKRKKRKLSKEKALWTNC